MLNLMARPRTASAPFVEAGATLAPVRAVRYLSQANATFTLDGDLT
jgi:hypothetical protein